MPVLSVNPYGSFYLAISSAQSYELITMKRETLGMSLLHFSQREEVISESTAQIVDKN